jgi:hypothetical protein
MLAVTPDMVAGTCAEKYWQEFYTKNKSKQIIAAGLKGRNIDSWIFQTYYSLIPKISKNL